MNYSKFMWICFLIEIVACVLSMVGLGNPGMLYLTYVAMVGLWVFAGLAYKEAEQKRKDYIKAAQQRVIDLNRKLNQ